MARGRPAQGPHNRVGGQTAAGVPPDGPVFRRHHAFLDELWARWRRRRPEPPAGRAPDAGRGGPTPDAVDPG
ncbi:tyrosinase family protein [Streptomyces shenzhenensis]|uniref:tyrosinase family protein n=1 Tax=Streptomyces shenzhenensis TaxID=943815 RepID=UPI003557D3D3